MIGVGATVLAVGLCSVLALPRAGAATAKNLSVPAAAPQAAASSGLVPRDASSAIGSDRGLSAVTPGFNWVDGVPNTNAWFLNFDPFGGTPSYGWDSAYVGYRAWTNSSSIPTGDYPQVGDVYYMHVVLGVVGNPAAGGDVPNIQVQLPQNTQLAISSATPMYCYLIMGLSPFTVTDKSNLSTCTSGVGTYLPTWLGYYGIPSYYMYEVQFPVRSTGSLDGISSTSYLWNTNYPWAIGSFETRNAYDNAAIYVPGVAVNTTITAAPPASTTSTSASFSFSSNKSGVTYQCRLDSGSWAGCSSPRNYSGLTLGVHSFQVAAVDSFGHIDPTPASAGWTITSTTTTTPTTTTPTTTTPGSTTPGSTTPGSTTPGSTTPGSTAPGGTAGSTASPATASSGGSGKVSARLNKKSFKRSEAAKVKVIYSFSPKSKSFAYLLSFKKNGKWLSVRIVKKQGSFKGSYTMTIKKLFGKKSINVGSYHLKLSADKNSKLLSFKVT